MKTNHYGVSIVIILFLLVQRSGNTEWKDNYSLQIGFVVCKAGKTKDCANLMEFLFYRRAKIGMIANAHYTHWQASRADAQSKAYKECNFCQHTDFKNYQNFYSLAYF